jgi:hypothetical protein
MVQSSDPQTYSEAVGNPLWLAAMQKEYDSLLENQTSNMVPLPPERNIFSCKWVHMIKRYKPDELPKDFLISIKISTSSRRLSMSRSFKLCGIVLE